MTLLRRASPLARSSEQLRVLEGINGHALPRFDDVLSANRIGSLRASGIEVLQINLGKLCNQTCRHCHVDAGPDRREIMSRETVSACLNVLASTDIRTLDITGGAPEMNPHFNWLVTEARRLRRNVIDRCNLTILAAPGFDHLPKFLAMPISRFLDDLMRCGKYDEYMQMLIESFNPVTVASVMCRSTLSVDWQGRLYDCDFNQMLDLGLSPDAPQSIHDFDLARLAKRRIVTGRHCFGCTAGCGSGCQGAIET